MLRLLPVVTVGLSLVGVSIAHSAEVESIDSKDGKTRLNITGEIQLGDEQAVVAAIKRANEKSRLVATVRLNSLGGNILEAVKIADIVRKGRIATAVLSGSTCASACFIIFAAGNSKYAHYAAMLGVHGASNSDGDETTESGAATVVMARVIKELGVPSNIIGKMVVTPPDKIVWLGPDELKSMGTTMLGQPSQLSSPPDQLPQDQQKRITSDQPMSILPDAQASRTPVTWKDFVGRAFQLSERQNGGRANVQRTCQPEQKVCVMGVWFKTDGKDILVKTSTDMSDNVVSREICEFNTFGDVRLCMNWDSGKKHRDMKDAQGNWYKVADE